MNEAMQPEKAASVMVGAADQPLSEADRLLLAKYDNSFTGTFSHTLDTKGRIVIPQAFREMLGKEFWITPSHNFKSIAIYPRLQYARMRERYEELANETMDEEIIEFNEYFDGLSYCAQECDSQGRVLLPARIRQHILKEEKEVEITGAGNHVRIVARKVVDDRFSKFMDNLPNVLTRMSNLKKR